MSSHDSDLHKAEVLTLENIESDKKPSQTADYTPEELKRVVRKLDLNLLPLCFILYTFSVLDVSQRHHLGKQISQMLILAEIQLGKCKVGRNERRHRSIRQPLRMAR